MATHFSTEFPIDNSKSISQVIQLACDWISGSPHTLLEIEPLNDISTDVEKEFNNNGEKATIIIANGQQSSIAGLRYIKQEKGLEWTTSIVCRKNIDSTTLSIQVSCEALLTAVQLPPPKKPVFIGQALSKLGGGMDGQVPVTNRPFTLSKGDEEIAAALINGNANNKLPIIYVSVNFDNTVPINPEELAKYVAGMAHVVVEPSREFSLKLKTLTSSKNGYGGSVCIYWPDSNIKTSHFLNEETPNPRLLQLEIAKNIRLALANRRLISNCSWSHLIEESSRKKLEQLKSIGSTEINEYMEAFDAEINAKDRRISEAENEISRLNSELRKHSNFTTSTSSGILKIGSEVEFYSEEFQDILACNLRERLNSLRESSRDYHVIKDLVSSNTPSSKRDEIKSSIKRIFKSYSGLDARTRSELNDIGFTITEEGKHYKLVYNNDGRYTFSIAKTPSDHRAGMNIASDLNNIIFG
ncbi:hypothetical protein FNL37_0738 [Methylovorus glucosotrophus]|uniref:hypothetical protein n=1 Tax=Methylovorus glucosotrophus TaxID=266009 RepID=UPI001331960F|nr:hypothetical protein [Methylovorus glucosotrophus]KAF0843316.1 hypothetical protein FNL37_0738 [Methylovorus glucosotrophus]